MDRIATPLFVAPFRAAGGEHSKFVLKGLLKLEIEDEDEEEDEDEDEDDDADFAAFGARDFLAFTIVNGRNVLELCVVSRCYYVLQRFSDDIWSSEKWGLFSDGSDHLKIFLSFFFWMIFFRWLRTA